MKFDCVDPKICHNFIFILILSSILSLNFKSQLHVIFFTHLPFNSQFLLFCILFYFIFIFIFSFSFLPFLFFFLFSFLFPISSYIPQSYPLSLSSSTPPILMAILLSLPFFILLLLLLFFTYPPIPKVVDSPFPHLLFIYLFIFSLRQNTHTPTDPFLFPYYYSLFSSFSWWTTLHTTQHPRMAENFRHSSFFFFFHFFHPPIGKDTSRPSFSLPIFFFFFLQPFPNTATRPHFFHSSLQSFLPFGFFLFFFLPPLFHLQQHNHHLTHFHPNDLFFFHSLIPSSSSHSQFFFLFFIISIIFKNSTLHHRQRDHHQSLLASHCLSVTPSFFHFLNFLPLSHLIHFILFYFFFHFILIFHFPFPTIFTATFSSFQNLKLFKFFFLFDFNSDCC